MGSFYPLYLKSRTVRNLHTGKPTTVSSSKRIRFRSL
ncbi:MAG: HU family DNA-binding protein [Wolbachia sp.]